MGKFRFWGEISDIWGKFRFLDKFWMFEDKIIFTNINICLEKINTNF